jgi:SAM-dependent methyltransferase
MRTQSADALFRLRHLVQMALPLDASVAVAGPSDAEMLKLSKPRVLQFPHEQTTVDSVGDAHLIDELEHLHSIDVRYLLVPAANLEWLETRISLATHVSESCRLVVDEPGVARVFALVEVEDYSDRCRDLDGLPFPPAEMMHLTAGFHGREGEAVCRGFFAHGQLGARWITDTLARRGRDLTDFRSVLDFGCGCGRVIRHWKAMEGPEFHGSDFNEYLIRWAESNLSFASFTVNGDGPPLSYADESFDLIYAVSVFTHFLDPLQHEWTRELVRVLKSGGILMITTHGAQNVAELMPEARAKFEEIDGPRRFEAGELVVIRPELAGTNGCASFHPESYVREGLAPRAGLSVVDFIPLGAVDAHQDVFVLEKPVS